MKKYELKEFREFIKTFFPEEKRGRKPVFTKTIFHNEIIYEEFNYEGIKFLRFGKDNLKEIKTSSFDFYYCLEKDFKAMLIKNRIE